MSGMMGLMGAGVGHVAASTAMGSVLALQQDMINSGNSKLLEVFVIVAAVSLFLIMVVVVGIAAVLYRAQKVIQSHVVDVKAKLLPADRQVAHAGDGSYA